MKRDTDTDYSGNTSIFEKPPFSDSATATRMPKPNLPRKNQVGEEGGLIGRLASRFGGKTTVAKSIDQRHAELEQERERQRILADRLASLTRDRDLAQAALSRAEAEFEDLKQRRASLPQVAKTLWGQASHAFTAGPVRVEQHYLILAAMDAAIADFPNARQHLSSILAEAEEALSTFLRESELEP